MSWLGVPGHEPWECLSSILAGPTLQTTNSLVVGTDTKPASFWLQAHQSQTLVSPLNRLTDWLWPLSSCVTPMTSESPFKHYGSPNACPQGIRNLLTVPPFRKGTSELTFRYHRKSALINRHNLLFECSCEMDHDDDTILSAKRARIGGMKSWKEKNRNVLPVKICYD
jgi:hypothetical protein